MKCRRFGARTAVTNQPARAFLCRLGFALEGVARQAMRATIPAETPEENEGLRCRHLRHAGARVPLARPAASGQFRGPPPRQISGDYCKGGGGGGAQAAPPIGRLGGVDPCRQVVARKAEIEVPGSDRPAERDRLISR
jgi:hypothetical protein